MEREPTSFAEFWPYYVSQHLNPTCRRLHFIGTTLAFVCLLLGMVSPAFVLAAPLAGYSFAWVGHFAFEKNRPASWHSAKFFVWSFLGDMRLWWFTLTGRMDSVVRSVF